VPRYTFEEIESGLGRQQIFEIMAELRHIDEADIDERIGAGVGNGKAVALGLLAASIPLPAVMDQEAEMMVLDVEALTLDRKSVV